MDSRNLTETEKKNYLSLRYDFFDRSGHLEIVFVKGAGIKCEKVQTCLTFFFSHSDAIFDQ